MCRLSNFGFLPSAKIPPAPNSEPTSPAQLSLLSGFSISPRPEASFGRLEMKKPRNFRCRAFLVLCDRVGIRTPNLLIRSQMLYPVELRSQPFPYGVANIDQKVNCKSPLGDFLMGKLVPYWTSTVRPTSLMREALCWSSSMSPVMTWHLPL